MEKEVVLITGCSSGIGRKMATAFKERGYIVIATARNAERIKDIGADLVLELDVTDDIVVKEAVEAIIRKYGRIDILINNAGYSVRAAVEEIDVEKTQKMFDVNVFGMVRMIQVVAPYMRQQNSGKIINIGSVSGRMCGLANGGYCASKHAVNAISETARYELQSFGIQVTVLEPGAMDTDFFHKLSAQSDEGMQNPDSPYQAIYERDLKYRKQQKRADVDRSVEQICRIAEKKCLKTRYSISLQVMFKILIHLPDGIKEKLILKFN